MKIVIDIPEGWFRRLQNEWGWALAENVREAIKNGTPLPKEHGRLIDENEANCLIAEGRNGDKAYFGTVSKDWEVIDFLKTVPTIIEAEREV